MKHANCKVFGCLTSLGATLTLCAVAINAVRTNVRGTVYDSAWNAAPAVSSSRLAALTIGGIQLCMQGHTPLHDSL